MADIESVAAARKRVATAYNGWLKKAFNTKLSEPGLRTTRDKFPQIAPNGTWAENQGKAPGWIVAFDRHDGNWTVLLPPSNHARRISGGINGKSGLQGLVVRVIPVARNDEGPFAPHPYWEWALVFVAAAKLKSLEAISSGGVFEYDPTTGALTARTREDDDGNVETINEPYVQSALFRLSPGDERWSRDIDLTYDQATEALSVFLNVSPTVVPISKVGEGVA